MKNVILGTAGHIDHGKTALVKVITGIDCDTHPEEKLRGITINLGFSHLELPGDKSLGIVDVPGHHEFVNTMVAGAHGIDILMLVIAADSGIMPQTIEHLQIAQTLGIKTGFVALTKVDLVDEESILMIENEVKDFLKDSFLSGCKIIRVSSIKGIGVDEIKNHLAALVENVEERSISKNFRMYIDRIFTVSGFGTVVTGSVLGGTVKKSNDLYLLPTNKQLRIRRMERHGKEVEQISGGNRVSLNLTGLNKDDFKRGMVLTDKIIEPTNLLDAKINLLQNVKKIGVWSDVIFLSGTFKNQARMHLIDKNKIDGKDSGIIQIHLSKPCFVLRGDRFIIRSTSGMQTLGGGEIMDPYPLHHRRRTNKLIQQLKKVAEGNHHEFVYAEVRKRRTPVSLPELTEKFDLRNRQPKEFITDNLPEDIVAVETKDNTFLMLKDAREKIVAGILKNIENYHKKNLLVETGKSLKELMSIFAKDYASIPEQIIKTIIDELITEKKIKKVENTWSLVNHSVQLDENEEKKINFVEEYFKKSDMQVPLMSDLLPEAERNKIDEKQLKQILELLTSQNKLYRSDKSYVHFSIMNDCKIKLLKCLSSRPDGITVAGFRDLIKGNRKICLLMLNYFDDEGITFRDGDTRKITEKGRKILLENE